jgi:hypothetical protein
MKFSALFLISILTMAAAQAAKQPAKAAPAKEAPKIEIPADAVKSDDGSYRYTDPKGKKWIYRKTPFGIARAEDKPAPKAAETIENAKAIESIKATEDGDTIRFERPGPFGTYKWQRKKTDLNELEQAAWDREKSRTAAKQD